MITIKKQIEFPLTYPLERLGKLDDILFFDIETTGFSGDYSNLYLIGCVCCQNGTWQLLQWFADQTDSEEDLLHAFFTFLKDYKVLVHFNGDGFDIPYLLKRCRYYGLTYDFTQVSSVDIYKKIKPYKKLLQLENMKQKSIEQFLGIHRKDMYSGGQLIEVYNDYLVTKEQFLYDLLILHNEDDLKGMPLILPILSYCDFLEEGFSLKQQALSPRKDIFGKEQLFLTLTYTSESKIPVPLSVKSSYASIQCMDHTLELTVLLFQGTLKYFYPDYQNYYYLIYEDTAIHKSVGEYVDKNARKKATAKCCYTKKEGCFLPQPSPLWQPALQEEYKSKITYAEYQEELFQDTQQAYLYLAHMLKHVF